MDSKQTPPYNYKFDISISRALNHRLECLVVYRHISYNLLKTPCFADLYISVLGFPLTDGLLTYIVMVNNFFSWCYVFMHLEDAYDLFLCKFFSYMFPSRIINYIIQANFSDGSIQEGKVSEIAKKLGVLASTLRYYDKEGLLPFLERSEGGMRMFKDVDYEFLKIIECLKSTGMQLKDIKKFIEMVQRGDDSIDERLDLFRKQKDAVEKQLKALQTTMDIVNYKCWYYETAKKAKTTSVPDNMTEDELPEDMRLIREKIRK